VIRAFLAAGLALVGVAAGTGTAASGSCCRWRHTARGLLPATYVISLAIAPGRPAAMYAGTIWRGIAKSVDGGESWRPSGPFPLLAGGAVPRPPDVMSLALDPSAPDTVYAGTNFGGVLKSVDGGASWKIANRGLASAPYFRVRVFNPVVALVPVRGALYAAVSGSGVFVSRDRAEHWQRFAPRLPEPRVESLALAGRTLYAATADGLFRSDGGPWRRAGLDGRWLEAVAVHGGPRPTIYAGALHEGVFVTRDGGRTWEPAGAGLGNLYVRTVVADPRRAGRVYAGTYGGVFSSADAGRTWSALNDGLGHRLVQALALGAGPTPTLFAGTLGGGVYAVDPG
jgi:photosystem II stability/assembly factor-like uncharacterized protein